MEWIKENKEFRVPIKSWCKSIESDALDQAKNLAQHPCTYNHVALMPDCHTGYGMPIGGVIACQNAVIPNAVGVDIGCGMAAVQTDYPTKKLKGKQQIREILDMIKEQVPLGEGHAHKYDQDWDGFKKFSNFLGLTEDNEDFSNKNNPGWRDKRCWQLAQKNLGTLGGGNHFIELQECDQGRVWLMLHSGSRNLGYRIAACYHKLAQVLNLKLNDQQPVKDLAYLLADSSEGKAYIRDMNFALEYALENRFRMMMVFKSTLKKVLKKIAFISEINIHHNYAALENHFGRDVWVHRKGATSAQVGEQGIIPGSMGTSSYIVKGLGNPQSFCSCSHGAGRKMGRNHACRVLEVADCEKAMNGIVFDRWKRYHPRGKKQSPGKMYDLAEAPQAYKNIESVIKAELDLIEPVVKLRPIGVLKG